MAHMVAFLQDYYNMKKVKTMGPGQLVRAFGLLFASARGWNPPVSPNAYSIDDQQSFITCREKVQ